MQMPKELEGWTAYEVVENFDSLLTSETSDLLFHIDIFEDEGVGDTWWICLNPAQQSEIISAYENFDIDNSRFEGNRW